MCIIIFSDSASSCETECGFSHSGFMVSVWCHNLADESVCAAQLVASWEKMGIIPKEKVVSMFNNKLKRGANRQDLEMISVDIDSDSGSSSGSDSDSDSNDA
jgi:hypothetical protein